MEKAILHGKKFRAAPRPLFAIILLAISAVFAVEWSSPNDRPSLLTTFKDAGIASTYQAFGCFGCQINNSLVKDGAKLNPAGPGYKDAIEQAYD